VHLLGRSGEAQEPRRFLRTRRRLAPLLRRVVDSVAPAVRSLRGLGVDALFSPLGTAAFHEPGLFHAAIAYDFQEVEHPEFFDSAERRRRRAFRADLRRCDRIAAISRFTADFGIDRLRLPSERVRVIAPIAAPLVPLRRQELLQRLEALDLSERGFLVYPANFWPHKNHPALLTAVSRVASQAREPFRLVLCGAHSTGHEAIQGRIEALGLADRVSLLPYVSDADLIALVQGARALVFPSLYEGFGLPVLEAFQLGTPVACSRIPALEEVAGDAALFFDAEGTERVPAITLALERIWRDEELRGVLSTRGATRALSFDGDATVRTFEELFANQIATRINAP
jgi:glycosyltransferase involved in cell wall biosynthesis